MEGVVELAEEIFHMPVRVACPQNVRGLADVVRNPIYSTGVGLLHYALHYARQGRVHQGQGGTISSQSRREDVSRRGPEERLRRWKRSKAGSKEIS